MISHLIRRRRRLDGFVERASVAGACLFTVSLLAVARLAPAQERANGPETHDFEHLRPIDPLAGELLHEGWLRSPQLRLLAETLEVSDLIVQIEARSGEPFRGRLRFMSGSPMGRWVRVTVRVPARRPDLLATLAHELQHAVEIASAPEARDRDSVEALFRRIGFRRDEPLFETRAALDVERRVRRELAAARRRDQFLPGRTSNRTLGRGPR